jgi:hypothetical protein
VSRVATYAQRIKKKTGTARKSTARHAAKTRPAAAPKAAPAAAPKAAPVAAPVAPPAEAPGRSDELGRLKDELQRVNQEISRIARLARPGSDPARNSQLPEKQQLLVQRLDLERKIRKLTTS